MISCAKSDAKQEDEDTGFYERETFWQEFFKATLYKELYQENTEVKSTEVKSPISFPEKEYLEARLTSFYTLNLHDEREYNMKVWGLFFQNDKYYFFGLTGGDPPCIEGSYQVVGNKVLLKYIGVQWDFEPSYGFDDILKEDWELEYIVINDSLYYSEGLTGKGIIFGRKEPMPNDGEIRIVNGNEIVIQRIGRIETKSDVTVRIGPSENFQHCTFEYYQEEISDDRGFLATSVVEFLREDFPVFIIGHSKNTDTVNGLTGYWYYCQIPCWPDIGYKIIEPKVRDNSAWIFGPLLDIK